MKATARTIRGSIYAKATPTGGIAAIGYGLPAGILAKAEPTEKIGTVAFLNVEPEQPQSLVWLVPQVGIEYIVTASNGLKWIIK